MHKCAGGRNLRFDNIFGDLFKQAVSICCCQDLEDHDIDFDHAFVLHIWPRGNDFQICVGMLDGLHGCGKDIEHGLGKLAAAVLHVHTCLALIGPLHKAVETQRARGDGLPAGLVPILLQGEGLAFHGHHIFLIVLARILLLVIPSNFTFFMLFRINIVVITGRCGGRG